MNFGGIGNRGGNNPIGGASKVVEDPKLKQKKNPFDVNWNQHTSLLKKVVSFKIVPNIPVSDASRLEIDILFNKQKFSKPDSVQMQQDGSLTGKWTVVPYQVGDYTGGDYHVQVKYHSSTGVTAAPLKIVKPGAADNGVSSFQSAPVPSRNMPPLK